MLIAQLVALFRRASIPIHGVSIGTLDDRTTWKVDYKGATDAQQAAGAELLATFDPATDTDYLKEQAEAAAIAYLARPETQAVIAVLNTVSDSDVTDALKDAYKSAYTLPC